MEELQKALFGFQGEMELFRKTMNDMEGRKMDKKELNETKIKIMAALDLKAN
jgi:hypothetical protein